MSGRGEKDVLPLAVVKPLPRKCAMPRTLAEKIARHSSTSPAPDDMLFAHVTSLQGSPDDGGLYPVCVAVVTLQGVPLLDVRLALPATTQATR